MQGKIGMKAPGIYRELRFSDYLAEPAMSASKLKLMYKSYRDGIKGIKSTDAMQSGKIEHLVVLERDEYEKSTVITPATRTNEKGKEVKFVRSGGHWSEFQEKNKGKIIISASEYEKYLSVSNAVYENPEAVKYLTGEKEVSIFWNDPVFGPSKMRCDVLNEQGGYICDLKRTAKDLGRFGFTCDSLGYDIQAAWYLRGALAVGLNVYRFIFVAYESTYPHDSSCQEAYQGMIDSGNEKIEIAADNLKAGELESEKFHGKFPGLIGVDFPIRFEEDF